MNRKPFHPVFGARQIIGPFAVLLGIEVEAEFQVLGQAIGEFRCHPVTVVIGYLARIKLERPSNRGGIEVNLQSKLTWFIYGVVIDLDFILVRSLNGLKRERCCKGDCDQAGNRGCGPQAGMLSNCDHGLPPSQPLRPLDKSEAIWTQFPVPRGEFFPWERCNNAIVHRSCSADSHSNYLALSGIIFSRLFRSASLKRSGS